VFHSLVLRPSAPVFHSFLPGLSAPVFYSSVLVFQFSIHFLVFSKFI
jgi:hypothetical protein